MAIPQNFIQELLARADVVEIVGRHVQLKKGGANLMGLCPFHGEKSPSFSVSPSKQFYYCFGCGASGDALRFLTEHTGDCQFGGLVHFYVPNVDECLAEFSERGIPVSEPPSNSLGPDIRDMLVLDPDGNRLSFITRPQRTPSDGRTAVQQSASADGGASWAREEGT